MAVFGFGLIATVVAVVVLFRVAARPPPLPPVTVTASDAVADALSDLRQWDASTSDLRIEAARQVEAAADGFRFSGLETHAFLDVRHEIAVFVHARSGLEFALVPGGTFVKTAPPIPQAAWPAEAVEVRVDEPFLLSRSEVTWRQWDRVTGESHDDPEASAYPIHIADAIEFCALARLDLPRAKEWEHACRAGRPAEMGNRMLTRSEQRTLVRRDETPDALGLLGMHSGLSEWCVNDLSRSGREEEPPAYESADERFPYVQKGLMARGGCNGASPSDAGDWTSRFEGGPRKIGVRPARRLRLERGE